MAEKYYINADKDKLIVFLELLMPDYFAKVQFSSNEATYTVECQDSDGNILFSYTGSSSGGAPQTLIKSGESVGMSTPGTMYKLEYGYRCKCGALLTASGNSASGILITKNNLGKTVFVVGGQANNSNNLVSGISAITWDDVPPIANNLAFTAISGNQAVPVPFATKCDLGTVSYTPDACYLPVSPTREIGTVKLGGTDYVTNGYWAVKDE